MNIIHVTTQTAAALDDNRRLRPAGQSACLSPALGWSARTLKRPSVASLRAETALTSRGGPDSDAPRFWPTSKPGPMAATAGTGVPFRLFLLAGICGPGPLGTPGKARAADSARGGGLRRKAPYGLSCRRAGRPA
jgi:hypothetical protein